MNNVYVPGQGSQVKGMGAELFAQFQEEVKQAQELLGYSIQELCAHTQTCNLLKLQYTAASLICG